MATCLKNTILFSDVGAGATVSLPHRLNVAGTAKAPDLMGADVAGASVSADTVNVTVTNNTAGPLTVGVYVEYWHTIERVFGGQTSLSISPFNLAGGLAALSPSGWIVYPGVNKAAEINAVIIEAAAAAVTTGNQQTVQLLAGTYTLEAPIVGGSMVTLQGVGDTTHLVPTYTGGDDDMANNVIGAVGTIDTATLNTTLSAIAPKNSTSVSVASAGSIAAGDYILISGYNPPYPDGDAIGESNGVDVILYEVVRVADSYAGGTTIDLAWPTIQHHGNTLTSISVQAVTPVVKFNVLNLQILGSQNGVVTADGVMHQYAIDPRVEGITASGCTRAAIEQWGVKGLRSPNYYNLGGNNAWYLCTSIVDYDIWGFGGADNVDRVNANGIPRYPIELRFRCTSGKVRDGFLVCSYAGGYHGGCHMATFANIQIRNIEITQAIYDRMVAGGELLSNTLAVLGWGSGFGPLNLAEFAFDVQYSDMRAEDVRAPTGAPWSNAPYRAKVFYFHDIKGALITNVSAINKGDVVIVAGVVFSDIIGQVQNLTVEGYNWGLQTENVFNTLQIDNYIFEGSAGVSPNANIPINFDHHDTSCDVRLKNVRTSNAFSCVRFGTSFTAIGAPEITIENLFSDSGEWSYCIVGNNQTGGDFSVGDIVEIDQAYAGTEIRIITPNTAVAGWERRLAIVATGLGGGDPGQGFMMIAPLPQQRATANATGAVAYGDTLEYVATRLLQTNNAAVIALGTAITRKGAGVGLIKIGIAT